MHGAELHLPRGTARRTASDGVVVTPESAGWAHCGLRVVEPRARDESRTLETGDDEVAVLPLSGGGLTVEVDGTRFELDGREMRVRARHRLGVRPDRLARLTLTSAEGCEVALASSRATRRLEPVAVAAGDVPVETARRGPGRRGR